jgi:two-component system, OmpR family, sensor kinase
LSNRDACEDTGTEGRLLRTLERLLAIEEISLEAGLGRAAHLVAEALRADKVDALILDPATESLVAAGTSATPMGHREHAIGMDRLPIANGGREVDVFQTGFPYLTGDAAADPGQLQGLTRGLGIRSSIVVPLEVSGVRRGVLLASSATPDFFTDADLRFLIAVARWVGMVVHRGELLTRVTAEAEEQGRRLAADELIAVLAHDLRNRVTPVKTRIDMIRRRSRREGRERDLRDADAAAAALDRFDRLIADLLDASRLEQGLFAIDPRPIDLAALARETAAAFTTPESPIAVRSPDEVIVYADPDRIRQVIENLLANAVKHSPPGEAITVEVDATAAGDGRRAIVTVADRGPGIAPEMTARLFRRFARGPGSSGLGLGLYLASRIAAVHGGQLSVESTPGVGARFVLTLPDAGTADAEAQGASGDDVNAERGDAAE